MRVLIASPAPSHRAAELRRYEQFSLIDVAADRHRIQAAITDRPRFDVVVTDLLWPAPDQRNPFDGLDVAHLVGRTDPHVPLLILVNGLPHEHDHRDEAQTLPTLADLIDTTTDTTTLVAAITAACRHPRPPALPIPTGRARPLYHCFQGRRGITAGRMAAAIAAGEATDAISLARAANVAVNTANKLTRGYLGPIMIQRGEHDARLPLTANAVYRWCGLHTSYLLSWRRRHGIAADHTATGRPAESTP